MLMDYVSDKNCLVSVSAYDVVSNGLIDTNKPKIESTIMLTRNIPELVIKISNEDFVDFKQIFIQKIGIKADLAEAPEKSYYEQVFFSNDYINWDIYKYRKYNSQYYMYVNSQIESKQFFLRYDSIKDMLGASIGDMIWSDRNKEEFDRVWYLGENLFVDSNGNYLNNGFMFKYVMIKIGNIIAKKQNPFIINKISVYGDYNYNLPISLLSFRYRDYFKQKVYDTQIFFPNLFQTYSKMSENFVANTSGSNMEFKINSYE